MYDYDYLYNVDKIYKKDLQTEKNKHIISELKNIKYYKLQIKTSITNDIDTILDELTINDNFIKSFYNYFYDTKVKGYCIKNALYNLETIDNNVIDLNKNNLLNLELKNYSNDIYNTIINKKYLELKKSHIKTTPDAKKQTTPDAKRDKSKKDFKFSVIAWLVIWLLIMMLII